MSMLRRMSYRSYRSSYESYFKCQPSATKPLNVGYSALFLIGCYMPLIHALRMAVEGKDAFRPPNGDARKSPDLHKIFVFLRWESKVLLKQYGSISINRDKLSKILSHISYSKLVSFLRERKIKTTRKILIHYTLFTTNNFIYSTI